MSVLGTLLEVAEAVVPFVGRLVGEARDPELPRRTRRDVRQAWREEVERARWRREVARSRARRDRD